MWLTLVLKLHFFIGIVVCQNLQDSCVLRHTNKIGECKMLKECQVALQDLHMNKIYPQTCGFSGRDPIVCCIGNTSEITRTERKSTEKCKEYQKYYKEEERHFGIAVIGGSFARPKEFPHMALVGFENGADKFWACGGSLISSQYVLTAAHCLNSIAYGEAKYVRLGEMDIAKQDEIAETQDFDIIKTITYPDYNPPSHYHDIALFKLDRPAKFNSFVRPACLYIPRVVSDDVRPLATGWGKTDIAGAKGSDQLLKVVLQLYGVEFCNGTYKNSFGRRLPNGIVDDLQICAGSPEEKDTCQGDSGGPLQIVHEDLPGVYNIIGITSFGKACGFPNIPSVYTRVSNYVNWIEDIVWQ